MPSAKKDRVLVVGCGALGGLVAALLRERGVAEVVSLSKNASIAAAVAEHGYRLGGVEQRRAVPGQITRALSENEAPFRYVILATQPTQVVAAAEAALPWLANDGAMVVLQNGLCEERISEIAGTDRVIGGIVAFGASAPEPGRFERTSAGGITLGRMARLGGHDATLADLAAMLSAVGPTKIAQNFRGARWSKLAINNVISTLGTLAGMRLGRYIRSTKGRYLAFEIMTETVEVARAEGVDLEKVSGTLDLDWFVLSDAERRGRRPHRLAIKHALLLAVGARYRRLRSSMLAQIERGREPAIDYLNGEVVTRGARHGLTTPVNALAVSMVHDLAAGRRTAGMHFVDELAGASPRYGTKFQARAPSSFRRG